MPASVAANDGYFGARQNMRLWRHPKVDIARKCAAGRYDLDCTGGGAGRNVGIKAVQHRQLAARCNAEDRATAKGAAHAVCIAPQGCRPVELPVSALDQRPGRVAPVHPDFVRFLAMAGGQPNCQSAGQEAFGEGRLLPARK